MISTMAETTTTAANKTLLRSLFEAINEGDFAALDQHPGFWQTRQVVPPVRASFSDWRTTHVQQIAEGDTVFTYIALEFTHSGPFAGVAPSGKRVQIEGCSIDQVRDGIVVEHNSTMTWPSVLRQLGVAGFAGWPVPTPRRLARHDRTAGRATEQHKQALAQLPQAIGQQQVSEAALLGGVSALMQEFGAIHAAFPDLQADWVTFIAEGDLVGARATLRGTQQGALFGFAPSGKAVAWDQFSFARIADGAVAEYNGTVDWTSVLIQLGLFPNT